MTFLLIIATSSFEELSRLLSKREIEGALLDSYVAAYHGDKFGKFRVNNIIQAPKAFGIVLGTKLSTKYLYGAFKDYFEKNKAIITKDVEENTLTLTVCIYFISVVLIEKYNELVFVSTTPSLHLFISFSPSLSRILEVEKNRFFPRLLILNLISF